MTPVRHRVYLYIALVAMMLTAGIGTYTYLGVHTSPVRKVARKPTQVAAKPLAFQLPGTIYLVQGGAIYSLSGGRFSQVTPADGWGQVSVLPDGSGLLAVKRSFSFSDVYQLGTDGHVVAQLTHNTAPSRFADIGTNHWSLYPRPALDGKTVFMSYDSGKQFDYEVDLAIWQMPLSGARSGWRQWSFPNSYTGGDVQPLPLASGAILYVKYDQDANGAKASQIFLKPTRLGSGTALTALGDDCSQPALSPDGGSLAMICSYEQQQSQLVLASFEGTHLGPLRVVLAGQLLAQPAWAPDGSGIAFFGPAVADQPFQLWWLPKAAYTPPPAGPVASASPSPGATPALTSRPSPPPAPIKPVLVTTDLGFDATSPIAWKA